MNTDYISSACYSDNTKRVLKEIHERLRVSPNKAVKESFWEIVDQHVIDALLYSVPKYTITPDGCKCEWNIDPEPLDYCAMYNLNFDSRLIQPFCKIELDNNNEKEKEKMEAKKCERCGKLYEIQDADSYIAVYLPGLPVSDWNKENYSESRIRKDNTRFISVEIRCGGVVDLCPECREKLKDFFESGKDDPMDAAVNINDVIKKAEE